MGVCMVEPRPKRNAGVKRVFSTPPPTLHGIRNCMEVYRSMARIAGVDLPREKRVEAGLRYIYGIGPAVSKQILAETGVDPYTLVKDLKISNLLTQASHSWTTTVYLPAQLAFFDLLLCVCVR